MGFFLLVVVHVADFGEVRRGGKVSSVYSSFPGAILKAIQSALAADDVRRIVVVFIY